MLAQRLYASTGMSPVAPRPQERPTLRQSSLTCRVAAGTDPQPPAQQQLQASSCSAASSSENTYNFTYRGSDGRLKATFEQAFKNARAGGSGSGSAVPGSGGAQAPWALSYQMSERYSLLWNDDLKSRMLKVCELGGQR